MPETDTSSSVFLSYAARDRVRMHKVIGELKTRGVLNKSDKLIDSDKVIEAGSNFRDQIKKAIEDSSKVILIWSGAGAKSEWVGYESGMAEALGKPIFVVMAKGEQSALPAPLSDKQVIELEDID
jgi:TIR domain